MKNLPKIKGLLCEAAKLREYAADNERRAKARTGCSRAKHEAGEDAKRERKKAAELDVAAEGNADMIVNLTQHRNYLKGSPYRSAMRSRAMRKLEEAEDILRREIGCPPDSAE